MRKGYKRFLSTIVTILVSFNLIVSPTFFDRAYGSATTGLEKSKLAPPLRLGRQTNGKVSAGNIKFSADTIANDAIERLKSRLKLETSTDSIKDEIAEAVETIYKMLPGNGKISLASIVDQIKYTNLEHPYRIKEGLPLTIVFGPQVFPAYDGKPPKLIAITFDKDFIAVNSVSSDSESLDDILGKGGCRWYQAGTDNVIFEDKLLQILPEAVRLGETMGDKNPWSGIFFDGGKTVFLAREGIQKERAIKRWVASSVAANVLLVYYIAGPDMGMGENEMVWIVEEADRVQKELNKQFPRRILATTSRRPGLGSYPHEPWTVTSISVVETMLEALENSQVKVNLGIKDIEPITISIQGFGDVGSGVIEYLWGLLTDLREQAARRELSTEERIRLELLERIKIVGVSDINGGIYSSKGLDIKELLRLRALRIEIWSKREREDFFIKEEYFNEIDPQSEHYGQISRGKHKVIAGTKGKKLRAAIQAAAKGIAEEIESDASTHSLTVNGLTVYVDSKLAAVRNDAQINVLLKQVLERLTPEEYDRLSIGKKLTLALLDSSPRLFDSYLYNDFKLIGINPDMLERGQQANSLFETTGPAEVLFKGATVIIPAAGPNVFTNAEQVKELKERNTKMIVEAANNSVKLGTEKAFHAEGILYFPGAVANFGGIFSSTREFIDVTAEGEEAILASIEERKRALQADIRNVARTNAGWLLAQYQNLRGERSIYDIHQEAVAKIRQRRTELLKTQTGSMLARVSEETNRGTNGLSEKVARLIAATELARAEVLGLELPPQKDTILSAVFTKITELVKKIFTAADKKLAAIALQYGLSRGHDVVLQYLSILLKKENIDAHPESEIMVLDGITEVENILARIFINKGDTVVFQKGSLTKEDRELYEYHGATLIEFEGVGGLRESFKSGKIDTNKIKFIQVLSDKKEGGEALGQQEREKVLTLTREYSLILVEDARYRDPVMAKTPSIKEMDENGLNSRVIQIRNLSPLFGEGVDIGCAYAVLPAAIAVKFEATQGSATLHPNSLTQVIVYQELLSRYAQDVPVPGEKYFSKLSDEEKNPELPSWISEKLSKYGKEVKLSEIRRILKLMATKGLVALAGGMPAVELFPYNETYELIKGFTEADWQEALTRSPAQGLGRFRKLIAERLNRENNLKESSAVNAEDIFVSDGSQEGLDLLGWLANKIAEEENAENEIITQKPTYLGLISAVKPFGSSVVPYHLNSLDGLAELERDLNKRRALGKKLPALIYVMPTFGNPDGDVMGIEAREKLLDIADKFGIRIAEDDPYSALKYDDKPLPARLLELSRNRGISDKVIYLGTISKIFTPGVRIGWTVASKEIIGKFVQYKSHTTGGASSFTQVLASRFFETGFVDRHIGKLISVYKDRRGAMIKALETYFKDTGATWTEGRGGFFIWLTLPKEFNAEALLKKMTQEGIEVEVDGAKKLTKVGFVPGWAFLGDDNQLRLSFPTNPPEVIDRAIKAISIAVKDKMFDFLAETLANLTPIGRLEITPEGIFLNAPDEEQLNLLAYKDTLRPYLALLRTAMTSVKPRWQVLTIPQGATKEQIKALITDEISPPATAKLTSIAKGTGTPARLYRIIIDNMWPGQLFTVKDLVDFGDASEDTVLREIEVLLGAGLVVERTSSSGNRPAYYSKVEVKDPDKIADMPLLNEARRLTAKEMRQLKAEVKGRVIEIPKRLKPGDLPPRKIKRGTTFADVFREINAVYFADFNSFNKRDLAHLLGVSEDTIGRRIKVLVDLGLVEQVDTDKGVVYLRKEIRDFTQIENLSLLNKTGLTREEFEQLKADIDSRLEKISGLTGSAQVHLSQGTGTPARLLKKDIKEFFRRFPEQTVFTVPDLAELGNASRSTIRRELAVLVALGLVRKVGSVRDSAAFAYQLDERVKALDEGQFENLASDELLNKPSLSADEFENIGITRRVYFNNILAAFLGDEWLAFSFNNISHSFKALEYKDTPTKVIILQPEMIGESLGFGISLEKLIKETDGKVRVIIDGSQISPDKVDEFLAFTGLSREGEGYSVVTDIKEIDALKGLAIETAKEDGNIIVVGREDYIRTWSPHPEVLKLLVRIPQAVREANLGVLPAALSVVFGDPLKLVEKFGDIDNTYIMTQTTVSQMYSETLDAYQKQLRAK